MKTAEQRCVEMVLKTIEPEPSGLSLVRRKNGERHRAACLVSAQLFALAAKRPADWLSSQGYER